MLWQAEINCPARTELSFLSPNNICSWYTCEFMKCGCFRPNLRLCSPIFIVNVICGPRLYFGAERERERERERGAGKYFGPLRRRNNEASELRHGTVVYLHHRLQHTLRYFPWSFVQHVDGAYTNNVCKYSISFQFPCKVPVNGGSSNKSFYRASVSRSKVMYRDRCLDEVCSGIIIQRTVGHCIQWARVEKV